MKSRAFVASSVENLKWAHAVQAELQHEIDTTIWTQGVFAPTRWAAESLLGQLDISDFGVFICTPDDIRKSRGHSKQTARDNVIFELGLYMGRLGRERSFILVPRGVHLHLPTDLLGVTPAEFDMARNGQARAAVGPACESVREAAVRLGPRDDPFLARQALEQMAVAVNQITSLIEHEQANNFDPNRWLAELYGIAHSHAQSIADHVWPGAGVVVSLKMPHKDDRSLLKCHYLKDRLPPRRLRLATPTPDVIPIAGTVAGCVYKDAKPIVVTNAEDFKFTKSMREKIDGCIGSIVAFPLFVDDIKVGVIKLDVETRGFFRERDKRLEAVSGAIAACFALAFKAACIANPSLRERLGIGGGGERPVAHVSRRARRKPSQPLRT
jgi:hypothetical protein